ncbi:MAG: hypothetical protein VX069_09335 [Cyanobacteriota bacterium]|nr:hypothetical protein [Cyanobacteriota bacterium]
MRHQLRWDLLLAVVVAAAFALRCLLLIDATGLWSDELYSVGKSFQASPAALIAMLREDTHPPAYYALLWLWGQLLGQSPLTLRLLSWLAYLAGGLVMVAQSRALGGQRVVPLALLLAFCSPFPVRFAIEGKSYALLVLVVALAWWWRRAERPLLYGCAVALASLTHFYGLFLFLATAFWDGWRRRWPMTLAAALAVLPSLGWIAYASSYLLSTRSGSWIGRPDFALLEDTLARAIGVWPIPKLLLLILLLWLLRRRGSQRSQAWSHPGLLDRSGLIPSAVMTGAVVLVSFFKPLAFSRYFVVVLPALLPWLVVQSLDWSLDRRGRWLVNAGLVVLLISWWGPGFAELDPVRSGVREQDHFRAVSQRAAGLVDRYSPRARLLNLSDRMEWSMGRIEQPVSSWQGPRPLRARLADSAPPDELWLATSGPERAMQKKLRPLEEMVERAGYTCVDAAADLSHGRLLHCRSESRIPGS